MKWKLLIYKEEKSKGNKTEVQIARRAQESPRYVAPGTNCSPGSNIVNVVQVQSPLL